MRHRESCNELTGRIGIRIYANGFAWNTKEAGITGEADSREIVHYVHAVITIIHYNFFEL